MTSTRRNAAKTRRTPAKSAKKTARKPRAQRKKKAEPAKSEPELKAVVIAQEPLQHYSEMAKKKTMAAMPDILDGLVKRAKGGSSPHTKLLIELGGMKDEPRKTVPRTEASLAKLLMGELAKRSEAQAAEAGLEAERADGAGLPATDEKVPEL